MSGFGPNLGLTPTAADLRPPSHRFPLGSDRLLTPSLPPVSQAKGKYVGHLVPSALETLFPSAIKGRAGERRPRGSSGETTTGERQR